MRHHSLITGLVLMSIFSTDLLAVSLVETQHEESQDIMYVDGYRMIMKDPRAGATIIMDLEKKTSFMVNTQSRTAVDISEATWNALGRNANRKKPPRVDARLEKVGPGPEIAGYETTHYIIYADDRKCSEKWTSEKAMKDSGWDRIWAKYGDFLAEGSKYDDHPCDFAENQVFRYDKYGMPLKEIDRNCETDEVVRIERDVDFDLSQMEIPADYTVTKLPGSDYDISSTMIGGDPSRDAWDGMDCSQRDADGYMSDEYNDEEYDEEYVGEYGEEYDEADYSDEEYPEAEASDEDAGEEAEDLNEEVKKKFKGFMNKFKKKDNG